MELFGLADCNNFFCSCERVFRPDLRKEPVIVLSNNDGCIVARSNEAKALGLKMGEPYFQVKPLLERHNVAVFSSNYNLYGDMSRRVMSMLSTFTPHLDIYSIDEAFLDLSNMGDAPYIQAYGQRISHEVGKGTGIPISIGIAPTKTLAKVASKFAKKYPGYNGACLIDTDEKREKALKLFDVSDVWGIGRRILKTLEYYSIQTAWDFTQKSESWVRNKFNVTTLRTWKELRGESCIDVEELPHKKSICTSRSFADEGVKDRHVLEEAVANFASACARKLREQHTVCSQVMVFAYTSRFRTDIEGDVIQQCVSLPVATADPSELISVVLKALRSNYRPGTFYYKKAGVVVWDITTEDAIQTNLFDPVDRRRQQQLNQVIDSINRKNGRDTIHLSIQGDKKGFVLKTAHISRQYTTNIDDILVVKA